jgi:hypothetical protein
MLRFIRENALIIFSFLLIGFFYASWFAARHHLGHWPVASVDDPKSIDGFWMWTYPCSILLIVLGIPLGILIITCEIVIKFTYPSNNKKNTLLKPAIGIILLIIAYCIIGFEPNDILQWLLD